MSRYIWSIIVILVGVFATIELLILPGIQPFSCFSAGGMIGLGIALFLMERSNDY